jgi:hypothetical protein
MQACLRSTRFRCLDGSQCIYLDLRRLMDIKATARGHHTCQFQVMKRLGHKVGGNNIAFSKHFDTLPEARRYWYEEATKLLDAGMQKLDIQVVGFHEED